MTNLMGIPPGIPGIPGIPITGADELLPTAGYNKKSNLLNIFQCYLLVLN